MNLSADKFVNGNSFQPREPAQTCAQVLVKAKNKSCPLFQWHGIAVAVNYRQEILSAKWRAGAIVAVPDVIAVLSKNSRKLARSRDSTRVLQVLQSDERSMLKALNMMRADRFDDSALSKGAIPKNSGAYLYANKRYLIPFGWYANPLPSTCSAAWVVMVAIHMNPFRYDS